MLDVCSDQLAPADGAAVAPEAALLAGTPYRVVEKIGAGGMGIVLEAEHLALGKRVVVKLLRPHLAREQWLVDRLRREARVGRRGDRVDGVRVSACTRKHAAGTGFRRRRRSSRGAPCSDGSGGSGFGERGARGAGFCDRCADGRARVVGEGAGGGEARREADDRERFGTVSIALR